jgi:hypothetical protein
MTGNTMMKIFSMPLNETEGFCYLTAYIYQNCYGEVIDITCMLIPA